jgi:hypothetical protein
MTLVSVDMTPIIEILTNKFFLEASQRTIYMEYSRACSMDKNLEIHGQEWTSNYNFLPIHKTCQWPDNFTIPMFFISQLGIKLPNHFQPNKDHFSKLQSELM